MRHGRRAQIAASHVGAVAAAAAAAAARQPPSEAVPPAAASIQAEVRCCCQQQQQQQQQCPNPFFSLATGQKEAGSNIVIVYFSNNTFP